MSSEISLTRYGGDPGSFMPVGGGKSGKALRMKRYLSQPDV